MTQAEPNPLTHPTVPTPNEQELPYWSESPDGTLRLPFCRHCSEWVFPSAIESHSCATELRYRTVPGRGTVYTYTICVQQFHPTVTTPFVVGIVELNVQAGLRVPANIVGCAPEDVRIGMPVTAARDKVPTAAVPVFVADPEMVAAPHH